MDSKHDCKTCGKHLTTTGELKAHKKLHTEHKIHKCEYCDSSFSRKNHLEDTYWSEKFKCDFCEKAFHTSGELKTHNEKDIILKRNYLSANIVKSILEDHIP